MPPSPSADANPNALERLLRRLDLDPAGDDRFVGDPGRGDGRVYGGMVAAQAFVAAARTVAAGEVHSLHAYFLRPGRHGAPIAYAVERTRDGRAFSARRVTASQSGEVMFSLEASFTSTDEGIAHQHPAPTVEPPAALPDWDAVRTDRVVTPEERARFPIDIRACHADGVTRTADGRVVRQVWMRPKSELPSDPVLHAAVLVFASDRGMLSTVARMHGIVWNRVATASLDHAVWFHRRARFGGWLLFTTESPAAYGGRALTRGTFHDEDGTLVASVAQEGLVRARHARVPK